MKNIFYHYTAKQFIPGIKNEGLTKGVTPIIQNGELKFLSNTQWLTKDASPYRQIWAIPLEIDYYRNEYRLKINIPIPYLQHIMSMDTFMDRFKSILPGGFNDFPEETEKWYIYNGDIQAHWIEQYRAYT